MATTTVVSSEHQGAHPTHPNKVAVGTIIWLSSELMFFAGLFAMYFTLRATNPEVWAEQTQFLNVGFATVNTLVLVSSSVTCQMGVLAAERGHLQRMQRWYILTFFLGAVFIGGQVFEYAHLIDRRGADPLVIALRLGVLPHDRLPRDARGGRTGGLPVRDRALVRL